MSSRLPVPRLTAIVTPPTGGYRHELARVEILVDGRVPSRRAIQRANRRRGDSERKVHVCSGCGATGHIRNNKLCPARSACA